MPEGDTVWLHAQRLDRALAGQRLVASDFRIPALATTDLAGSDVREVVSRGKHLLMRLRTPERGDWTLRSHLRMDGTWRTVQSGERWSGRPAHTIRVVLTTERCRRGRLPPARDRSGAVVPRSRPSSGISAPTCSVLDWDPDEAVRRLAAQPDRQIAVALLDQRNLAGIGNFYKCEVLFLRGVSPWTPGRRGGGPDGDGRLAQRHAARQPRAMGPGHDRRQTAGNNAYVFERAASPVADAAPCPAGAPRW